MLSEAHSNSLSRAKLDLDDEILKINSAHQKETEELKQRIEKHRSESQQEAYLRFKQIKSNEVLQAKIEEMKYSHGNQIQELQLKIAQMKMTSGRGNNNEGRGTQSYITSEINIQELIKATRSKNDGTVSPLEKSVNALVHDTTLEDIEGCLNKKIDLKDSRPASFLGFEDMEKQKYGGLEDSSFHELRSSFMSQVPRDEDSGFVTDGETKAENKQFLGAETFGKEKGIGL